MDLWKRSSSTTPSISKAPLSFSNMVVEKAPFEQQERVSGQAVKKDVHVDIRELYFLIMHFLSSGPCQRTFRQFYDELLEHELLPRRYHAWYSRSGSSGGNDNGNAFSLPLGYDKLVERYPHIERDHLVKLLRQLLLHIPSPLQANVGGKPNAADVPTLLGFGSFSLLDCDRSSLELVKPLPGHMRWPHMQADQVHGLSLREIGGGFAKHHRAPSVRSACYALAKPSTMVQKMQTIKKIRGHRNAVYCAIFDRSGRYVITGSDDRLVKVWSMETAFCLASCRGHEGDITDLAVSSNNVLVASASNDFVIRVWRLPDGLPISVLRGHTGAVTAIAFSPRPTTPFQLLSSSDDGTCRIWEARYSQCSPRIYVPKPDAVTGRTSGPSSNGPSSSNGLQCNQILCCAYNANGTVFVTGSSDTYARVWSACRSSADENEQPIHEMDVLSGHENDVNYVQFSGCAATSKFSMSDALKEEHIPKFKNSWYSHDNIVTCSRDGSAIIWVPKSRRWHGKSMRWTKSYHLKVPPPPLPPQPPRGGPRQRILPTPRGVNMIVWSLDNRFVLAAIMDCRICVWNAGDGSLVHSLTGHTESSYVLDVHPFNPRIAMSAGYDGKTIIWDIWEGIPIRTYEIGRFKLVDGKFSPDGTSIVLSDDVGQIYLLNTGQGDCQKDAKYDQFFLGDYRPLIRDISGHVLDQESQLPPYKRNILDPLCDSSMIPYPEPYQTMFQKRRLGALGTEWRPPSIKFAIGPDIGLGQDYQMPPLEDLDRIIEPLPEFIDAIYWEPENEIISDDNDSEYNIPEESSEAEQASVCYGSYSDPDCSEESDAEHNKKDALRRSRRGKHKTEVERMTSSGRRVKKRNFDDHDGSISMSNIAKKIKCGRKTSKKKSSKAHSSRPQRIAARNALNMFSKITGTSTDGDDEDDSEAEMSDSDSDIHSVKSDRYLQNALEECANDDKPAFIDDMDMAKPPGHPESQGGTGNRKKLVFKISLRDSKKLVSSEDSKFIAENQAYIKDPSSSLDGNRVNVSPKDSGPPSIFGEGLSQTEVDIAEGHLEKIEDHMQESADNDGNKIKWGEVKIRSSKRSRLEDIMPNDADTCTEIGANGYDEQLRTDSLHDEGGAYTEEFVRPNLRPSSSVEASPPCDFHSKYNAASASDRATLKVVRKHQSESDKSQEDGIPEIREVSSSHHSQELKENSPPKVTRLKIRTKGILGDSRGPSRVKFVRTVNDSSGVGGVMKPERPSYLEHNQASSTLQKGEGSSLHEVHRRGKSQKTTADLESSCDDASENTSGEIKYDASEISFSEATSDAIRRTRSMKMKATSREPNPGICSFRVREGRKLSDNDLFEEKVSSSKKISRSARNKECGLYDSDTRYLSGRKSSHPVRKLSWLILSMHEEAYRYVPQQGDEVVYFRQGHQEYLESTGTREKGPWISSRGLRAEELCTVETLEYATAPGSGDSCCKLILRFVDSSSTACGKAFKFTLPELINFPDFLVEKTRYDNAVNRNWTRKDKCLVWWRNENGEDGSWWDGNIESSQAKSEEFPNSPWERYKVQYNTDPPESHLHSPWELHDPDIPWKHPHIDYEIRDKLLSSFAKLERSDHYGIHKLNEASQKSDFFNRFPVPLYPDIIQSRLENNYYRSFEAVKHDIQVMMENAKSYFTKNADLSKRMKRLSDWYDRKLSEFE